MREKITRRELNNILHLHNMWFIGHANRINLNGVRADLSHKDLTGLDLSYKNLEYSICFNTDFTDTDLTGCLFRNAYLIDAKGLPTQEKLLDKYFEKTNEGYIVYKTFGLVYDSPEYWDIRESSFIEEKVDMDRRNECSYGINVATLNWILSAFNYYHQPIYKCLLSFSDLDKVCAPYGSDGKIRCGRLKILEEVNLL